jgi:hypothetical protein
VGYRGGWPYGRPVGTQVRPRLARRAGHKRLDSYVKTGTSRKRCHRDRVGKCWGQLSRLPIDFVLGSFVAQRDRIFDPNQTDPQGRTNAQRINLRLAPLGKEGKPIVLHHAGQSSAGPIIEMTSSEHGAVRVRQEPSQINRTEFREFRVIYRQARLALIRGLD